MAHYIVSIAQIFVHFRANFCCRHYIVWTHLSWLGHMSFLLLAHVFPSLPFFWKIGRRTCETYTHLWTLLYFISSNHSTASSIGGMPLPPDDYPTALGEWCTGWQRMPQVPARSPGCTIIFDIVRWTSAKGHMAAAARVRGVPTNAPPLALGAAIFSFDLHHAVFATEYTGPGLVRCAQTVCSSGTNSRPLRRLVVLEPPATWRLVGWVDHWRSGHYSSFSSCCCSFHVHIRNMPPRDVRLARHVGQGCFCFAEEYTPG